MLSAAELDELRRAVDAIYVDEKVKGYIVDLVAGDSQTRTNTGWS